MTTLRLVLEGCVFAWGSIPRPIRMPEKMAQTIAAWDVVKVSPFSESYYDTLNKDWNVTPEGSLRVSDHWAFESNGRIHCAIVGELPPLQAWSLGQFRQTHYHLIETLPPSTLDERTRLKTLRVQHQSLISKYFKIANAERRWDEFAVRQARKEKMGLTYRIREEEIDWKRFVENRDRFVQRFLTQL